MTADETGGAAGGGGARKPRCGWPKPVLPKGSGVTHCSACHGRLRFDLHINQWVHDV